MNTILEEAAKQLTKTWRKIFSGRRVPCDVVQCIFIIYVMDGGWDVGGGGGGGGGGGKGGGGEGGRKERREGGRDDRWRERGWMEGGDGGESVREGNIKNAE